MKDWNALPQSIVSAGSLALFKATLPVMLLYKCAASWCDAPVRGPPESWLTIQIQIRLVTKKSSYRWQTRATRKHAKNCSNSTCLQRCRWQYWPIFMRAVASEICETEKFTENSNLWSLRSSKVSDLGANRKPICDLLLVINSNFSRIYLTPPNGGTPVDIDVIYTPLESAFNGLQFRRWHYRSIFIRLAVVASKSREIAWNSDKIWPYSSSRSSKVIDVGVNGKPMYDFLLVTNSNFGRICYRFWYIEA